MTTNSPNFLDSPNAPDVFADAATGFFMFGGNVRITFESLHVDHSASPGPINRVVIGRLVMPVDQAEGLAKGLLDFIEKQRNQPTPNAQSSPALN